MTDSGETGVRRRREITPGEIDPARSSFIDEVLAKYRSDQAAEKPAARRRINADGAKLLKTLGGVSN